MLKIEKISSNITVKEEISSLYKTRYILEPLYRGYGNTLGNSLRRIFLSSIPGTAIKGIKIDGVVSEFSTIEGVKENVVDIILNIKELVIKASDSKEKHAKLVIKGPTLVTGKDLQTDNTFEVVNKDHVIATITGSIKLEIEFLIDTGTGVINSEDIEKSDWPVGFIPIDALYSPIINVSYSVEDTMVGRITNFDKLTFDVETNGSVETGEVMSYAIELLQKHLEPLKALGNRMEYLREIDLSIDNSNQDNDENKLPDIKIEHLDLSVRSFNCLKKNGIENLKSLAKLETEDLLGMKNLGKGSLLEITNKLKEYGINIDKNNLMEE